MIVDWHCHWIPQPLADAMTKASIPFHAQGQVTDWGPRLANLESLGIGRQVLSLPGLFGIDNLPIELSLPLVRTFNDSTAELVAGQPLKFAGLASLPLADLEQAVAELERAMAAGLLGAILPNDGFLTKSDAERWRPLFAAANRKGAHLFIHPGSLPEVRKNFGADPVPGDNATLRQTGFYTQARISPAALTLLLTDFLDAFPNVTVQVANLGGTLPFVAERLGAISVRDNVPPPDFHSRNNIFFDTASFGKNSIALACEVLGANRVIYGTDSPIFDVTIPLDGVRQADLGEADKASIFAGQTLRSS
jgi:predicted TIM-barrel fold metal-dependent hydrolase